MSVLGDLYRLEEENRNLRSITKQLENRMHRLEELMGLTSQQRNSNTNTNNYTRNDSRPRDEHFNSSSSSAGYFKKRPGRDTNFRVTLKLNPKGQDMTFARFNLLKIFAKYGFIENIEVWNIGNSVGPSEMACIHFKTPGAMYRAQKDAKYIWQDYGFEMYCKNLQEDQQQEQQELEEGEVLVKRYKVEDDQEEEEEHVHD